MINVRMPMTTTMYHVHKFVMEPHTTTMYDIHIFVPYKCTPGFRFDGAFGNAHLCKTQIVPIAIWHKLWNLWKCLSAGVKIIMLTVEHTDPANHSDYCRLHVFNTKANLFKYMSYWWQFLDPHHSNKSVHTIIVDVNTCTYYKTWILHVHEQIPL